MNWLRSNYSKHILLAAIQSALLTILVHPGLQLAAGHYRFNLSHGVLWVFLSAASSILAVRKSKGRGRRGLVFLGSSLAVSVFLGAIWRLSLTVYIPLALALLLAGVRFDTYSSGRNFAFDWGWSSFILLIFALLGDGFGYDLGFSLILVYFVLGIIGIVLWNAKALESEGLHPNSESLGRFILLFVSGAGILAAALALILSPSLLQRGLALLRAGYRCFVDVLIFVMVRPFAWLLSPLFRWAEEQELTLPPIEIVNEPQERLLASGDPEIRAFEKAGTAAWVVLIVILGLAAWLVFRKILRRKGNESSAVRRESKESVFSGEEVLSDLGKAWRSLLQPLSGLARYRKYRGDDPLLIIRNFYARFVVRSRKRVPYRRGATPTEYSRSLSSGGVEIDEGAVQTLTELYNKARYGEIGSAQAAEIAEQAYLKLRRLPIKGAK